MLSWRKQPCCVGHSFSNLHPGSQSSALRVEERPCEALCWTNSW